MKYEDIYLPPAQSKELRQTAAQMVAEFKAKGGVVRQIPMGKSAQEHIFDNLKADYRAGRWIRHHGRRKAVIRACKIDDAVAAFKEKGPDGLLAIILASSPYTWYRRSQERKDLRDALAECGFQYLSRRTGGGRQHFKFLGREYMVG